jgi:hypothetical protein
MESWFRMSPRSCADPTLMVRGVYGSHRIPPSGVSLLAPILMAELGMKHWPTCTIS